MSTNGTGTAVVEFDPATFEVMIGNMGKSAVGRVDFLKLTKGGEWVMGQDEEPIEEGSIIHIDPNGFIWGWQCWANTEVPGVQAALLGSEVVPLKQPMPPRPERIPENGRPWSVVNGLSCVLDGKPLKYSVTSVGGLDLFKELSKQYAVQFRKDRTRMVAVAKLQVASYKHPNKTFGRVYTPVLNIVDWVARLPEQAAAAPEPEKLAPPAKPTPAKKARKPSGKAA